MGLRAPSTVDQSSDSGLSSGFGSLRSAGWLPQGELDERRWIVLGRQLGQVGRGVQWWVGDWLRYGFARWGERYAEAARITGYDYGSLRNMASLAAEFDLPRRRDKLSWSHHAAVAALDAPEQDRWLDHAEAQRMSVADLRLEIREARRLSDTVAGRDGASRPNSRRRAERAGTDDPRMPPPSDADHFVCPRCGHAMDVASDRTVADW